MTARDCECYDPYSADGERKATNVGQFQLYSQLSMQAEYIYICKERELPVPNEILKEALNLLDEKNGWMDSFSGVRMTCNGAALPLGGVDVMFCVSRLLSLSTDTGL